MHIHKSSLRVHTWKRNCCVWDYSHPQLYYTLPNCSSGHCGSVYLHQQGMSVPVSPHSQTGGSCEDILPLPEQWMWAIPSWCFSIRTLLTTVHEHLFVFSCHLWFLFTELPIHNHNTLFMFEILLIFYWLIFLGMWIFK